MRQGRCSSSLDRSCRLAETRRYKKVGTVVRTYDIAAVGECLIDFLNITGDAPGRIILQGNPGGAPANVLASASKLGLKTAFIGKVGKDAFGSFLVGALERCGIDVKGMIRSAEPTTLAIVSVDGSGERSFAFYRTGTADVSLSIQDVPLAIICDSSVFHFGSVSMTSEPSRSATLFAAAEAAKAGAKISFDPNLRPALWNSLEEAKQQMHAGLSLSDYVKVNEEELLFMTGMSDIPAAAEHLFSTYDLQFLAVTRGENGSACFTRDRRCVHPGYRVNCVDSTGAGDAFWGAALYRIIKTGADPAALTQRELEELASYANASGALTATRTGAIPAIPDDCEIRSFLRVNEHEKR